MTTTPESSSESSLESCEFRLPLQVLFLMGSIYGAYCNEAPVRHLGQNQAIQAIRVGDDEWSVTHGRRVVDGRHLVGMDLVRRAGKHAPGTTLTYQFFIPFEELHELRVGPIKAARVR